MNQRRYKREREREVNMAKRNILSTVLVLYLLHDTCVSLNRCGIPRLCWCLTGGVSCLGEGVYILPRFSEPLRKTTRILSIDSTEIRYLPGFKLQDWENLAVLIIVNNKRLISCEKVISDIAIQAELRGVTVITSCGKSTTIPYRTTSQDGYITESVSELSEAVTSSITMSEETTETPVSDAGFWEGSTIIMSERTTGPPVNSSCSWMKPFLIVVGVFLVFSFLTSLLVYVSVQRKRKLRGKNLTTSPIYLPTIQTSTV